MTADHLSTVLPAQELVAPAHWHTVEFISDLHLDPAEPGTLDAWRRYLRSSRADAIFMLGDLFEVWVGDDTLDEPGSFEAISFLWPVRSKSTGFRRRSAV